MTPAFLLGGWIACALVRNPAAFSLVVRSANFSISNLCIFTSCIYPILCYNEYIKTKESDLKDTRKPIKRAKENLSSQSRSGNYTKKSKHLTTEYGTRKQKKVK